MYEVAYQQSAYNLVFAAGVAFCEIRRTKPHSDPLTSPGQHTMIASISQGRTAYAWTAPEARTTIPGCTNPFWVGINTYLGALGILGADSDAQEGACDVQAAVAAAAIADATVTRIIGTGPETQFRFKGTRRVGGRQLLVVSSLHVGARPGDSIAGSVETARCRHIPLRGRSTALDCLSTRADTNSAPWWERHQRSGLRVAVLGRFGTAVGESGHGGRDSQHRDDGDVGRYQARQWIVERAERQHGHSLATAGG